MVRNQFRNEGGFPVAPAGSADASIVSGPLPGRLSMQFGDPVDLLPPPAAERLHKLRQQRDDAILLVRSDFEETQNQRLEIQGYRTRLNELRGPRGAGGYDLADDDVRVKSEAARLDKKMAELKRLSELSELRGERSRMLNTTIKHVEDWVRSKPSGTAIAMCEPVDVQPRKGEDLQGAIERVRRYERELHSDAVRIAAAPHPSAARKEAVVREVEALAQQGKPNAANSIEHGEPVAWPLAHHQFEIYNVDPGAVVFGQLIDIRAFMSWWDKEGMIQRLSAEIDEVSDDEAALSDDERKRKIAEISADLLALEYEEAALVWRAQGDGAAVMHRPDIDPRALLGVTLVPASARTPQPGDGEAGWVRHLGS